jgi:hypothetical protein
VRRHDRLRTILLLSVVLNCLPGIAAAQWDPFNPPRDPTHVDVSGTAGFRLSTDWSDLILLGAVSPATGALEQVLGRDLIFRPGPVYDATVMYWQGRYGFRAHGGFSRKCLAIAGQCGSIPTLNGPDARIGCRRCVELRRRRRLRPDRVSPEPVGMALCLLRLRRDHVQHQAEPQPAAADVHRRRPPGTPDITITELEGREQSLLIAIDELGIETKFALNFGIGTDLRIPLGAAGVGLRLELSDNMHESPLNIQVAELNTVDDDIVRANGGLVHNLRASAGLVLHFGR